jgi:ComF family protein
MNIFRLADSILHETGLDERRCVFCLEPFVPDNRSDVLKAWLCADCRRSLHRREAGYCPYCGEPFALEDAPCMPCGECLQHLPPWREFLFWGLHEGLLRELLLRGKFKAGFAELQFAGRLLAECCAEHYEVRQKPDVILPMPLSERRLVQRGFNQCVELARPISRMLDIPVRKNLLTRRDTRSHQAEKNREERLALPQVFESSPRVKGMQILLVDDICTTGATLSRAVKSLLHAGAAAVDTAVVARTSRHTVHDI